MNADRNLTSNHRLVLILLFHGDCIQSNVDDTIVKQAPYRRLCLARRRNLPMMDIITPTVYGLQW